MNNNFTYQENELLKFVEEVEQDRAEGRPRVLKEELVAELFKQLCNHEREVTAWATNTDTGDVFVCFSFAKGEEKQ